MNDFDVGAGGFITGAGLLLAIRGIGVTIVFLYMAWICLIAYQNFCDKDINANEMIFVWGRAVFMMMVLIFILTL